MQSLPSLSKLIQVASKPSRPASLPSAAVKPSQPFIVPVPPTTEKRVENEPFYKQLWFIILMSSLAVIFLGIIILILAIKSKPTTVGGRRR